MLQRIRDNVQGLVAKVIIGFICATFALFGVDTLLGFSGNKNVAAEVNGEEIDQREVAMSADLRRRQLLARMGDDIKPELLEESRLRQEALETLINRRMLLQFADDLGLGFSDDQVRALIRSTPEFQRDGRFDEALFDGMVREQGMSKVQFVDFVREEMIMQQLRLGFMESAFITDAELGRLVELENQRRDLAWLRLDALELGREEAIDEAAVEAWYHEHERRFMTEEQVSVRYLLLDKSRLAGDIEIPEDEILARYAAERESLGEQAERDVRHILVKVEPERSEDEARARAEALRERLLAGEDFAELAKAESDDAGTASLGGSLGMIPRGMFNPKFEEPVFALPLKTVSEPIRTGFGYHLVEVLEERAPEIPTLESMREGLVADIRSSRVDQRYADRLQQLAERSFEAGDLRDPAEALGLDVRETEFFTRDSGDGLADDPRFRAMAFSGEVLDEGLNSQVLELDENRAVVIRVAERRPAELRPLEQVRDAVVAGLQRDRGKLIVAERAGEILRRLQDGEPPEALAVELDFSWQTHAGAERGSNDVPPQILEQAFRLPAPVGDAESVGRVDLANGDSVVLRVTGVEQGRALADYGPAEKSRLVNFHATVRGGQAFDAVRRHIERNAEIERF